MKKHKLFPLVSSVSYYPLYDLALGGSENSTAALSQTLSSRCSQQSGETPKYYEYRNHALLRNSVTDDSMPTLKQN